MYGKSGITKIIEFFTRKDKTLTAEEQEFFEESAVEKFSQKFDRNDRAKIAALWLLYKWILKTILAFANIFANPNAKMS